MTGKQIKVLLLEDEAAHAEAIRRALESADSPLKVHIVGSLKEFRDYVAANTPDIALIDMVLPDGNGIDLLSSTSESNTFPMLILTSHGNEMAAVAALKAGALDYVVKSPETFANIPYILTVALNQWSLILEKKEAEKALQVSEQNFSNSMNNSPLGIRIVSEEGETLYTNRAFLDIYGYKDLAEFKNTSVKDRYTPESYVEFSERREKRRRREPLPDTYEVSIVRKDGTVRQLQVIRKEILWAGERQYQTIYQDITERQQMTQRINELNNILQLIKSVNQLIVKIDNEPELLQQACRQFVASRQYQLAWVGFKQEGSYDISPSVQCGETVDYLASIRITWDDSPFGRGPTGTAVKTGKLSVMRDILQDPRFAPWRDAALKVSFQSVVALPLVIRDEVIGALNLYSTSAAAFDDKELELLSEMAGDLSLGIEKIRLREERLRDEEALKESEDRFRYVFDNSAIGKSLTSMSGAIHVNKAFCDMLGYSQEELANKSWQEITHPDDIELTQKAVDSLVTGKEQTVRFIKRYVHKNGSDVWTEVQSSLRRNKNGKPLYLITSIMDITERKRAEEEIRQSEAKYSTLVEKSNDGIVIIENGIIQFMNTKLEVMTGFTSHKVLGRKFIDFCLPEEQERLMERHMKRMSGEKVTEIYETKLTAGEGSYLPVEINATNIIYQEHPVVLAFIRDITERKRAEETLRESERRYHDLFEGTADIIQSVSLDGRFVFVNRAWHEMLGYSESELSQLNLFEIIHPESLSHCQELFSRVIAGESVGSIQATFVAKDGRSVYVEGNATARSIGGKIVATHGFFRDITESKRAEEAMKASEQNFRNSMDSSSMGIRIMGDADYTLYANQAVLDIFGYQNIEELRASPPQEHYTPESYAGFIRRKEQFARGELLPDALEFDIVRKDGTIRHIQLSSKRVLWDGKEQNQILYNDITERKQAEEALKASENSFRNSLDNSPIGIRISDRNDDTLYANQAFLSVFGYENIEELKASPPLKHYTPESHVSYVLRNERILQGEPVPDKVEVDIIRKDGAIRHLQLFRKEVLWDGKQQYQILYDDITERKQAEEELKASEQNFRNSIDSSSFGIRISDIDNHTLYANQTLLDIFGYNNIDEVIAKSPQDYYSPESYAEYLAMREKHGFGEVIPDQVDIDIIRKDGAVRHLQASFKIVLWNGKKQYQTQYNDITARKKMEEALRESEEKYRLIVENTRDIIFTVNAREEYVYVSPSVKGILGYNPTELIGKLFLSLVHPEDRHILEEETARAGVSGHQTSGDSEYRTRHASGEWRWVVSRGTRVMDANGNFLYFIGIIRDITAYKRAEKEKQILEEKAQINSRLAAVGEMAAGIAHEINNPLTGVLGFSQMLLENKNVPEDIKENLKLIADGSQRVAEIVKRLLTFARQSKPIKAMANLNELIENTLKLREYVLKTNNINVVTRFDPELPWSVVDPGQMQQVFLNLIVNAEQAMKKAHGKGTLTITTKKIDNNIRILFQDDGPGITRENLGHLFEPFFTTKEPGEGTGLGLSLSRSIVLEHDGKMNVESEFGRGAIFIIDLPIIEALLSEAETAASSVKAQPEATKPGRILVIDDEAGVRTLIEKTLTRMGHSVDVIDDAGAALDIIDAGTVYDVILTDVRMPGMSGIELYPLIIRRMPSMKNRIIFITGDVMGLDIRTFLNQNNLPYLSKPFDIELLKEKIAAILKSGQERPDIKCKE